MLSSSSSRSWVLSAKVTFISIGIISVALLLKHSVPLIFHFLTTQLPIFWTCVLSWLRPPYLYVLINAIIIFIAASSRFNQTQEAGSPEMRTDSLQEIEPVIGGMLPEEKSSAVVGNEEQEEENGEKEEKEQKEEEEEEEDEEEFVISKSNLMASEKKKMDSPEKPLASSRFVHPRTVRSTPEGGRTLGVNKPKRHETLETTWKAITEGRPIPLTRHLNKTKRHETLETTWKAITEGRPMPLTRHPKKSETWENYNPQAESSPNSPPARAVGKSETFKDRTNQMLLSPPSSTPSPVKMRKEPSLSQDELNRRVEAFIKKFNEEMRLQRQESLNQYREMMGGGL